MSIGDDDEEEEDLLVDVVFEIGEDVRIAGIDGDELLHCVRHRRLLRLSHLSFSLPILVYSRDMYVYIKIDRLMKPKPTRTIELRWRERDRDREREECNASATPRQNSSTSRLHLNPSCPVGNGF